MSYFTQTLLAAALLSGLALPAAWATPERDVTAIVPEPKVHLLRGDDELSHLKYPEAIVHYNRAIYLEPTYALAYMKRGLAYEGLGLPDQAQADYRQVLLINPQDTEAHLHLANLYLQQKNDALALAHANAALQINANEPRAYLLRGLAQENLNQSDKALKDYNQALFLDKDYPEAYLNRGNLYLKRKQYDLALTDFTLAKYLSPLDGRIYQQLNLASQLLSQNNG